MLKTWRLGNKKNNVYSIGVLAGQILAKSIKIDKGKGLYMVRTKKIERIIANYKLTMNNKFRCSVNASQQIFSSAAVVSLVPRPSVFHSQSATGLHNMAPHRK